MAEVRSLILQAAENSVLTASVFIGNSNLVEEPISIETSELFFAHLNKTLRFITDSRSITASYPDYKRAYIMAILQLSEWEPTSSHQVLPLAKILEYIRHLAQILPFGNHLSIHLQLCLLRFIHMHIRRAQSFSSMKRIICAAWNLRRLVRIRYSTARDIQYLHQLLESSTKLVWHHPISLFISSCSHFVGQSDS